MRLTAISLKPICVRCRRILVRAVLLLLAPNIYVEEKVRSTFLARINEYFEHNSEKGDVLLSVGGMKEANHYGLALSGPPILVTVRSTPNAP